MTKRLHLIVAACENGGIGINGKLPWNLKSEMQHFVKTTTDTRGLDPSKSNVVIMGRNTWNCIPEKVRPLKDRINMVVSRTSKDFPGALAATSLRDALSQLSKEPLKLKAGHVWIIGGQALYNEALSSPLLHRIFFTRILDQFECDAFFPIEMLKAFRRVEYPGVPESDQEENGVRFRYEVYEANGFDGASDEENSEKLAH